MNGGSHVLCKVLVCATVALLCIAPHCRGGEEDKQSQPTTPVLPGTIAVGGTTYEDVRWGTVTPVTVTITHKSGIATIPLAQLPPDVQSRLGYDSSKASQYAAAQAEQRRKLAVRNAARRKLKELTWVISARITQALPDGALAEVSIMTLVTNQVSDVTTDTQVFRGLNGKSTTITKTRSGVTRDTVQRVDSWVGSAFIRGLARVHDGEYWQGTVYGAGDYGYTTVMGAYKKVRAFSVDPPAALIRELEE